jgi:hypothetical protein
MPWVKLDCHWYQDPAIEEAAEQGGPVVLALFPVVLAMAKAQADGGRVEFSFRALAHALFTDQETILTAIRALVSAGVLSLPEASERAAVLAFDPDTWRRWNDAARKAVSRNGAEPHG